MMLDLNTISFSVMLVSLSTVQSSCPSLENPNNVTTLCQDNTSVVYECLSGQELVFGNLVRICMTDNSCSQCLKDSNVTLNVSLTLNLTGPCGVMTSGVNCLSLFNNPEDNSSVATCQAGQWSGSPPSCLDINCGWPPDFENSILYANLSSNLAGDIIQYTCQGGYGINVDLNHTIYSRHALCSSDAQWEWLDTGGYDKCEPLPNSKGCFRSSFLIPQYSNDASSVTDCLTQGRHQNLRLCYYRNDTCFCGNDYLTDMQPLDNIYCSVVTCNVNNGSESMFCGGTNDEVLVFYTTESGCYEVEYVPVIENSSFPVAANKLLTCKLLCLAQNAYLALLHAINLCTCLSSIEDFRATLVSHRNCRGTTVRVENLDNVHPLGTECDDLYHYGVITKGVYLFNGQINTYCSFYDDTMDCPSGWISYDGHCYLFVYNVTVSYADAVKACHDVNATLATIGNDEAFEFFSNSILDNNAFKDFPKWYIGLYDNSTELLNFAWLDGQLFNTKNLHPELLPGCIFFDGKYFTTKHCSTNLPFICQSNTDELFCIQATSSVKSSFEFASQSMTLSYCQQLCRGQGHPYALLQGINCSCLEDMNMTYVKVPFGYCSTSCPGNVHQMCGGDVSSSIYTVIFDTEKNPNATSCQDLETQGISGGMFMLPSSEETTCPPNNCPLFWMQRNDSCYFSPINVYTQQSSTYVCSYNYGALPSSIEDRPEFDFIFSALTNIPNYALFNAWSFGTTSLPMSGTYSHANGLHSDHLPFTIEITNMKSSTLTFLNQDVRMFSSQYHWKILCEKEPKFVGCIFNPSGNMTHVLDWEMQAPICIETCRGRGFYFALINTTSCYCSPQLPTGERGICIPCRSTLQPCGKDQFHFAVFDIDYYPEMNNVTDIYNKGITLEGVYLVGNNTLSWKPADNSTHGDDRQGFVGYEGISYRHFFTPSVNNVEEYAKECKKWDAEMLTIRNQDEHVKIRTLLLNTNIFSESILVGAYDAFKQGTPSWSSGATVDYIPYTYNVYTKGYCLKWMFNFTYFDLEPNESFSFICKAPSSYLGCYQLNLNMVPVLLHYGNMDLTLCKQLCMVSTGLSSFAFLQTDNCYCGNLTGSHVEKTKCNSTTVNIYQTSGQDDFASAYALDKDDIISSCSELYAHGVFFKSPYMIGDETQQVICGFEDMPTCKTGWYGRNGTCFKFLPNIVTRTMAVDSCFQFNGFLLSPFDDAAVAKVKVFITEVEVFSYVPSWWTSFSDIFNSGRYLTSEGFLRRSFGQYTSQQTYIFNISNMEIITSEGDEHSVLCQYDRGYQGCFSATNPMQVTASSEYLTSTQCIQICLGLGTLYSAVQNEDCFCINDTLTLQEQNTGCTSCPGYDVQACGSEDSNLYSVYLNEHFTANLATSCYDLLLFQVTVSGWYMIQPNFDSFAIKVFCDVAGSDLSTSHVASQLSESVTFITSSHVNDYDGQQARLRVPFSNFSHHAWIPLESDLEPWIQADLDDEYYIFDLFTLGLLTQSENLFVEKYDVFYRDIVFNQWTLYGANILGNVNATEIAVHAMNKPVATTSLKLYPRNLDISVALKMTFTGRNMKTFDYWNSTLGCFTSTSYWQGSTTYSLSETNCKAYCEEENIPYFSFDLMSFNCSCHPDLYKYGRQDNMCENQNEMAVLVKSLHSLYCPPLEISKNATNISWYAHVNGVHTVKSKLHFTCYTGHLFDDETTNYSITCLDNLTWSGPVKHCSAVECPSLEGIHRVINTTNTAYLSTVHVTCDTGYHLGNLGPQATVTCTESGAWSVDLPQCELLTCGSPPVVARASFEGSNFTYLNEVTYKCDPSSNFSPGVTEMSSTCEENGTWSFIPSECYFDCLEPNLRHRKFTRLNATVGYLECDQQFHFANLELKHYITCTGDDSQWSPIEPCIEDDNVKKKSATFAMKMGYLRTDSHQSYMVSTLVMCADICLSVTDCLFFNFNAKKQSLENCRIFKTTSSDSIYHGDWQYVSIVNFSHS